MISSLVSSRRCAIAAAAVLALACALLGLSGALNPAQVRADDEEGGVIHCRSADCSGGDDDGGGSSGGGDTGAGGGSGGDIGGGNGDVGGGGTGDIGGGGGFSDGGGGFSDGGGFADDGGGDDLGFGDDSDYTQPTEVIVVKDTPPKEDPKPLCGGDSGKLCLPDKCANPRARAQMANGDWSCADGDQAEVMPNAPDGPGFKNCLMAIPDQNHPVGRGYDEDGLRIHGELVRQCIERYSPRNMQICQSADRAIELLEGRAGTVSRLFRGYGWSQKTIDVYLNGLRPSLRAWQRIADDHKCPGLDQGPAT
jgi:hypothetical protein